MGLFYFLLSKPAAFSLCIACLWPHPPPFIPHSTKAFRSMQTWTKPQLLLLFSFFSPLRNHLHKTASFCGASFNFCVGFFVVFFGGGEFWGKPTAVNLFPFGLPWTMMPHVDLFFSALMNLLSGEFLELMLWKARGGSRIWNSVLFNCPSQLFVGSFCRSFNLSAQATQPVCCCSRWKVC